MKNYKRLYNELLKQNEELKESPDYFTIIKTEEMAKYNLLKRVEHYKIGCLHVLLEYLNDEYIITFNDDKIREYKTRNIEDAYFTILQMYYEHGMYYRRKVKVGRIKKG